MTAAEFDPNPSAADWRTVKWETHTHDVLVMGRRVHYVDIGHGPTIFLVHGMAGSWQQWLENLCDLATDHRVLALDVPGLGNSEALVKPVHFEDLARSVAAFAERMDLHDVLLVGHSMGGMLCVPLAQMIRARITGLVLVSSGGAALAPWRSRTLEVAFTVAKLLMATTTIQRLFIAHPSLRAHLLSRVLGPGHTLSDRLASEIISGLQAPGILSVLRASGVASRRDTEFRNLDVPTLLIWGTHDRLVPISHGRRFASQIPGSTLLEFAGVGHLPMIERGREFNSALRDFGALVRQAVG